MVWLGLLFDSVAMILTFPPDKLQEILDLVSSWVSRQSATLKELQVLLGKLLYIAQVYPPACLFLNSFQVQSLLRTADISMRTPSLRRLPILPDLLHRLCLLTPSLGPLGPSMRVCLILGFFAMLR